MNFNFNEMTHKSH